MLKFHPGSLLILHSTKIIQGICVDAYKGIPWCYTLNMVSTNPNPVCCAFGKDKTGFVP